MVAGNKGSSKREKFATVRGMKDILPDEQGWWKKILTVAEKMCESFGCSRIDTPIVEPAALFERTVGEGTDIVEKEMYTFVTKGKDRVTLRPELTASIARAYIEHGMDRRPQPVKLYSTGPIFRYERPQEGRYRQAHQIDVEVFGRVDALLDAQIIQLAMLILSKSGIKNVELLINSIGCPKCRKPYIRSLTNYLKSRPASLCGDCKKKLKKNPLRVLDCKDLKCKQFVSGAPQIINALCEECHAHFKSVLDYVDELKISYQIDATLVRGLDYYNRTVFEVIATDPNTRDKYALLGGGRYDGLIRQLGGRNTPGIGFAIGIERLVKELMKTERGLEDKKTSQVFLIQLGDLAKKKSLKLFNELQRAGVMVAESFGKGSLKAQLKAADRARSHLALIIGQKEALDNTVIVRDMTVGAQEIIPQAKVIERVKKILKQKSA